MDMNTTFYRRKEDCANKWHHIDATGKALGRLATEIAELLMGKNNTDFAPHTDTGSYVVITNAKNIMLTGNKIETKTYIRVSGWMGGKKEILLKDMMKKDCTEVIHLAVKGMMPDNRLTRVRLTRLKVYAHNTHPHIGQIK
jgi:large subunit ribosomal protein L13